MIFSAFARALSQIGDPRFRAVLGRGLALTISLLIAAYAALLGLIHWSFGDGAILPLVGEVTWVGDLLGWTSLFVMILASVFLMIPVASAITSMFLDEVATAVEDVHYPHVPRPAKVPFWDAFRDTVNFLGVLVAANAAALIVYIFANIGAPVIFIALNGYLLGREYFQVSAMRHLGREGARALRKQHTGTIWLAGALMAVPLTVPLLNLFVPVFGAAVFTHIYHALAGTGANTR
ncbi:MAG: EI24 domain-containing protein [Pseudomonadota bacterium]